MFDTLLSPYLAFTKKRQNSLSVPIFDGAFKPNNLLDDAEVMAEHAGLEDLVANEQGKVFAACGPEIVELGSEGKLLQVAQFDQKVTALAIQKDGSFVVGLGDKVITGFGTDKERMIGQAGQGRFVAVTALFVQANGKVLVTDGSDQHPVADWPHDLMRKNCKGRVVSLDPETGEAELLASGMAYAYGACETAANGTLISESWSHSISQISQGKAKTVIDRLPGYPCRFAPSSDGGFWLTLFCSRTQLVEFVLKENDYRQEMMRTIEPEYWISPSYGSGADFLEPLQGGGVKQMGVLKPWAPPRSYGLLAHFNADLTPDFSLHSRVGGINHGICAAAQVGDALYVLSKGAGKILRLSIRGTRATLSGKDMS